MTWSPVSFGLCPGDKTEDAHQFFIKLANKVNSISIFSVNLTGNCWAEIHKALLSHISLLALRFILKFQFTRKTLRVLMLVNLTPDFYSNLLYISTSVWVLCTPNAGQNSHFQRFCGKKLKKERCSKILQKTRFFKFAPETLVNCFIPKK